MRANVIDNDHRMVRSAMTPTFTALSQDVEWNWVVGVIGPRPRGAAAKPRMLLVEHVLRRSKNPVVQSAGVAVRGAPLARGTSVRGGVCGRGAVVAVMEPGARETPVGAHCEAGCA
jgi:hypothetical protein